MRKIETLQRLQNRAHLIIKTARVKDNWSCDWLNISNIISFDRLVMTYKIINKLSPESLWDKFELRSVHSKYETRNCHDLQIPRLNTERAKSGFKYSALKLWNDIPADIREVSTLKCFKKKLKAHLLADLIIITENTTPWKTSNISIMPVNFFFLNVLFKLYI